MSNSINYHRPKRPSRECVRTPNGPRAATCSLTVIRAHLCEVVFARGVWVCVSSGLRRLEQIIDNANKSQNTHTHTHTICMHGRHIAGREIYWNTCRSQSIRELPAQQRYLKHIVYIDYIKRTSCAFVSTYWYICLAGLGSYICIRTIYYDDVAARGLAVQVNYMCDLFARRMRLRHILYMCTDVVAG